jgi:hypothetical protein
LTHHHIFLPWSAIRIGRKRRQEKEGRKGNPERSLGILIINPNLGNIQLRHLPLPSFLEKEEQHRAEGEQEQSSK